jgi:uncharacterized protein YodC (DUF2158 family)
MSKTINDFQVGDRVYHLSNTKLIMVVVEINKQMNEVVCRWVDNNGQVQKMEFMPEELGDSGDLAPKIFSI